MLEISKLVIVLMSIIPVNRLDGLKIIHRQLSLASVICYKLRQEITSEIDIQNSP